MRNAPSPPSLWRNRDYVLLWSGQMVSLVGDRTSGIAFPLLILALSHSTAEAGLLGFVGTLPYVFLSLPAGALVDRWDRKRVMILCDTGRALALGSIPVAAALGHLSTALLFGVAAAEGILFVFFDLAQVAAIPRIVGKDQIARASAQNNISFTVGSLTGPPLGGTLFAISRAAPFLVDAVSYAGSVLSLLFMRTSFQEERAPAERHLRREIAEGLRWLWSQPLLRFLTMLAFGFNIVFYSTGNTLILIVLAKQLHTSSSGIGAIFAIAAFGGLGGAFCVAPVRQRFAFGTTMIAVGWVLPLLYPLYLLAPNVVVLGIITALLSGFGTVYNIVQYSYRLAMIPDELQGRVNSVFRLVAFGGQPVGAVAVGFLLATAGPTRTVLAVTFCLVIMATATTLSAPIRRARATGEARAA